MNKRKLISVSFAVFSLVFVLSTKTYALSFFIDPETFSFAKCLPIIVGATLIIESLAILLFTNVKRIVNVSYSVLVANFASFAILRLAIGLLSGEIFYKGMLTIGFPLNNWVMTVLILIITLAIELPIIWLMLRPFTDKRKRLLLVAAAVNILTVLATAFVEYQINIRLIN